MKARHWGYAILLTLFGLQFLMVALWLGYIYAIILAAIYVRLALMAILIGVGFALISEGEPPSEG